MSGFRSRRYIADSAVLEEYDATPMKDENENTIGISIGEWSIASSSSRIGNEGEMDAMETIIQAKAGSRVCLPEIVFSNAYVSLKVLSLAEIRFTAQEALEEWAECHRYLKKCSHGDTPYKGVSVIKSIDAKIWEEKISDDMKYNTNSLELDKCSTELHYDWTFSSPFSGNWTIKSSNTPIDWNETEESGIDMQMLVDQSQPILYFDDVNLYEDDMHDNGYVSLRCKLRVMPTCVYILLTLFVRVDHVLIRVKEVRMFSSFQHKSENKIRVFKDVVWRECPWTSLEKERLPMDISSWRVEEEDIGGATVQKRLLSLIRNLPVCPLPKHLMAHSYVDIPE